MCICVNGIDCASFYYFSTGLWNCTDSMLFFAFHLGLNLVRLIEATIMAIWDFSTKLMLKIYFLNCSYLILFCSLYHDLQSTYNEGLRFLIENMCIYYVWLSIIQHKICFAMGANCASLLADLFLYLYEADFVQCFLKNEKKLTRSRGGVMVLNATFNDISVILWRSVGGGNRIIRRKPQTCHKSHTHFIT